MALPPYGPVRAPDFPAGLDWLGTDGRLRLADLRGRFVLLDFWTTGCINCLHVLPDLARLEARYPDVLVVVGVHSGKFAAEGETATIRQAIRRHGIAHPVVNDHAFAVWEQYAVRAWPTVVLIDPRGVIVGRMAGEGVFEPVDATLQELLPRYEADGLLDRTPLALYREADAEPAQMLTFPAAIHAGGGRLFIADTGAHRLLVTDLDGRVLDRVGRGAPGLDDGAFDAATFRSPRGMAYDATASRLYVADTENHAVRVVDVTARTVATLAGTGAQAPFGTTHAAPGEPLNAPWDVLLAGGRLYAAMAGAHQLWRFDCDTGAGAVYAGNGYEHLVDGPRLDAQLAQPSALATDGGALLFLDAESSSLRRVGLEAADEGSVAIETLVGEGLFDFGDVDGRRPDARLQHPLGLAWHDGLAYIADTYNHRIKRYFARDRAVVAWAGTGTRGAIDGPPRTAQFDEPNGLAVAADRLYVADTGNHAIRAVDLATGAVDTLAVAEPLRPGAGQTSQVLPPIEVAPGSVDLDVHLLLPEGCHPNTANPGTLALHSDDPTVARPATEQVSLGEAASLALTTQPGTTSLRLEGAAYVCTDDGRCLVETLAFEVPLGVRAGAPAGARVDVPIRTPLPETLR